MALRALTGLQNACSSKARSLGNGFHHGAHQERQDGQFRPLGLLPSIQLYPQLFKLGDVDLLDIGNVRDARFYGGAMPMGEMGDYTFINHNGGMIGAVMDAPEKDAKPYWNFALQVADIDAAKAAVEKGGGTVRMGPMELPNDSGWLVQADDPQGAKIMFTGLRKG